MIIANWKMNGSKKLVKDWIDSITKDIEINPGKDCIFCPPICYIDYSRRIINEHDNNLKLGSQKIDTLIHAPFTGGLSAEMLVDLGCQYVIIGHSEQRMNLHETNLDLSSKLKNTKEMDLKPIFCIGESLEQKNSNITKEVLNEQLEVIEREYIQEVIIAYEPVWAIGTGQNAEISYINEIHAFIKQTLQNKIKSSIQISVVYGGSVNLDNCKEIYCSDQVDGLLIGGASLNSETFTKIYNML
tara:strand:+ start:90 stop:818 length:729 start_codon:yes stop_codon:yes gene_type:complete